MPGTESLTLSAAEFAWLRVQKPTNPSFSTVVLGFDHQLDVQSVKARIEDRLMALDRFRQRIEASRFPLARPRWREHDRFTLADHLIRLDLDRAEQFDSLESFVAHLQAHPLDSSLPLWQIHFVHLGEGGSAIVARIHQAIADGTAVPHIVLRLADTGPSTAGTKLGLEHLVPPREVLRQAGEGAAHTRMLCNLIASRSDRDNPLRGEPTTAKAVAWSDPVESDAVEDRASRSGFLLTEVLLAALSGTLRAELHRRDTPVGGLELRAVVPLNLRQPQDSLLGTREALSFLQIPLSATSFARRLEIMRVGLERLRDSANETVILGTEPGDGLTMSEIEERSLRLLGHKATLMFSILDGPTSPLSLDGVPISNLMWWPALPVGIGLAISVVAYAEQIRFGVLGDGSAVPDVATLAQNLVAETLG